MYAKAKKLARKGAKYVRKRYTAKPGGRKATGGVRVAKMAKDILYLKSVLNPEKKRWQDSRIDEAVGQINGNGDGGYVFDYTPYPAQGVTAYTRNGASIKLHSSVWQFQFSQQHSCQSDVKLVIEMYAITGEPYTGFTFRNERFQRNFFINPADIRDYNTQINPDNYMKGKCIARRNVTIKADQISGTKTITDVKVPMKYNNGQGRHIRFSADSVAVESGQLYVIIRADRGNMSTTTASTLTGIPDVGVSTGLTMSWNRVDYFYDN